MNVLLDTNILNRIAEPGHPKNLDAANAIAVLRLQGYTPCIVPQNVYEFWVVSTRPTNVNGLGKSVAEAATELANFRSPFTFLDDPPSLFTTWEKLVQSTGVVGKNAHDARLVAAMLGHGMSHLLTFNDQDFRRYASITVLAPAGILRLTPPPSLPSP